MGHAAMLASANVAPIQWRVTIASRFPDARPTICKVTARTMLEAQKIADGMALPGESITLERA